MGNVREHEHDFRPLKKYCDVVGCDVENPGYICLANEVAGSGQRVVRIAEGPVQYTLGLRYNNNGEQFGRIMQDLLPRWAVIFETKNLEYGDGSANDLGLRGQFSDIYRKVVKLRTAMWDGHPERLTSESTEQILFELIGNLFLALDMLPEEYK